MSHALDHCIDLAQFPLRDAAFHARCKQSLDDGARYCAVKVGALDVLRSSGNGGDAPACRHAVSVLRGMARGQGDA